MSNMYLVLVSVIVLCCVFGALGAAPGDAEVINNRDFAFPDELKIEKLPRSDYRNHYHHHHHNPDFHHGHGFDWDPDGSKEAPKPDGSKRDISNTSLQVPLEFIRNINEYNVSDLLLNFVEDEDNDNPISIHDRFGDEGEERNAAAMAKKAACIPELHTVKIATSDDPSVIYIPECTRIERCGGCCSHTLLACQPQDVEYVNLKVIKTQYTGGAKLKIVGKEVVLVEKHNKCKCDCRVQAEDCNKYQEYKKSECRCACLNHDEEKKCNKNPGMKLWNPDMCACQCRETLQCSTGSYFDQNECKCVMVPVKRRFADYWRPYRSEVVPLDEDD